MRKTLWKVGAGRVALCLLLGLLSGPGNNVAASETDAASDFHRMSEGKVNRTQQESAEQVANKLLVSWREGRFNWLPDDFSLEMIQALPPADQEKAHLSLKYLFGDFQGMKYVEAYASTSSPGLVVYRFKGRFSAANASPEIRVSVGPNGLISGFWVRHWKDELN
jgi:hypothetical protein